MSIIFVLLILTTGQYTVVHREVPSATCEAAIVADGAKLIELPQVRSVQLACVPEGIEA